jgi:hypothetical protein
MGRRCAHAWTIGQVVASRIGERFHAIAPTRRPRRPSLLLGDWTREQGTSGAEIRATAFWGTHTARRRRDARMRTPPVAPTLAGGIAPTRSA